MKKDKVVNIGNEKKAEFDKFENEEMNEYLKKFNELTPFDIEKVKLFTLNSNPDMVCIGMFDEKTSVFSKCAKVVFKDETIKVKNDKDEIVEKVKPIAIFMPFGFPINYEIYHMFKLSDVTLIEYVGENQSEYVLRTHEIVRKQYFLEFERREKDDQSI